MTKIETHHLGEDLAAMAAGGESLPHAHRTELDAHVASCAACRKAIAESRAIFVALDALPAVAPSERFDRALFNRLDELDRSSQAGAFESFLAWFKDAWTLPRIMAGAGVAFAATLLAIFFVGRTDDISTTGMAQLASKEAAVITESTDAIELAENLELLQDLDLIENLDVVDDLDVIAEIEGEGEPG